MNRMILNLITDYPNYLSAALNSAALNFKLYLLHVLKEIFGDDKNIV
ncbi:Formin [Hexamita inflata]|uniref:FH2 domain n=1 Tax=Hexamita inflata TaxID=28002 RepID=A0AA86PH73_9EUKA|nr:FH2 domain [Hexamita inflata]